MIRLAWVMIGVFCLPACAGLSSNGQASDAYKEKQIIAQANTSPDNYAQMDMCPPQPIKDASGEWVADEDYSRTPYSTKLAYGFAKHWSGQRDEDVLNTALQSYVAEVSYADSPKTFGALHCWTGNLYQGALIGELKDLKATWVSLIIANGNAVAAQKCTYSHNPDAWSGEACPEKESVTQ